MTKKMPSIEELLKNRQIKLSYDERWEGDVDVTITMTVEHAIKYVKRNAMISHKVELTDEEALNDFICVYWAYLA